jgi:perosamine synthetase
VLARRAPTSPRLARGGDLAAVLARRYGRPVALTGSGREALLVVLRALGVRPPDVVVVSAYNAVCVPRVLAAAGYRVEFADIDRATFHMIPPSTGRAVIVPHLEGSPAPIEAYRAPGRIVIEDCAHALGARLHGREVGTLADGAILSFGYGKNVNAFGGGVAIAGAAFEPLARPSLTQITRRIALGLVLEAGARAYPAARPALYAGAAVGVDPIEWLFRDRGDDIDVARPTRMSNVSERLALAGLAAYDRGLPAHRARVDAAIATYRDRFELQRPIAGAEPAWLELTALVPDRDRARAELLAEGIDAATTWMACCDPACEVAARVAREAIYLTTEQRETRARGRPADRRDPRCRPTTG